MPVLRVMNLNSAVHVLQLNVSSAAPQFSMQVVAHKVMIHVQPEVVVDPA